MAETKQKKEVIVLAALLAITALVWYLYFGKPRIQGGDPSGTSYTPINAEDYQRVFRGLEDTRSTEYKSSGRNIFIAGPPPLTQAQIEASKPKEPPPPPVGPTLPSEVPPPQLAMKFFGYGTLQPTGPRRAFLLDGEEVHIVSEGDTIMNHIKITHIGNDRIEYEDINTGKKNTSNLEMPPPV